MANLYEDLIQSITGQQAEQKAAQQIFQTKTKAAMEDKERLTEQQLVASGRAAELKTQDELQIAEGVAGITDSLSADPTDPTSLMARNNVAITALNEKLLSQYDAIDTVQNDSSFIGQMQKMFILPDLLHGADQIHKQKEQFLHANTALQGQLINQTAQVSATVKRADTELIKLEQQQAAAASMLGVTNDKLKTAEDYFRVQHMVSTDAMAAASAVAKAKQDAILMPLQIAMAENSLAQFKEQREVDAIITDFAGWPAGSATRMMAGLKSNPQAYNAMVASAVSGKFHTPFDAMLLKPYINEQGLTNADGTAKPQLTLMREMAHPVIAERVSELRTSFVAAKQKAGTSDADINKLLNNPAALKAALDTYQAGKDYKDMPKPSDMATWNPAQIYREIPQLAAQTPLIQGIVDSSNDKTSDMTPVQLANLVVKSNMNVPSHQIAQQMTVLYQNVLVHDKQRPIYEMAGIPTPDSVKTPVQRMGLLQKFSQQQAAFAKPGSFAATHTYGSPRNSAVDWTNAAEVTDYVNEIKLQATMNAAK